MKPLAECAPCILKWIYGRTASSANKNQRYELMRTIMGSLAREFVASGNLGLICNKTLHAVHGFILDAATFFNDQKDKTNQAVEALLPKASHFIKNGSTPSECFIRACRLASAGNVSPIGAPTGSFTFPEAEQIIEGSDSVSFVMDDVYSAVKNASRILFITDNAGEIGLDSLLIDELKEMGAAVSLMVKEDPFFEDATKKDAVFFGLDKKVDELITTQGVFFPGENTRALDAVYERCDLIISKGVFNVEALYDESLKKPIIYLLKIKCNPIAQKMNAHVGDFTVKLDAGRV